MAAPLGVMRKRADFQALRKAPGAATPGFLLVGAKNDANGDQIRFGVTVTKKLGGAVVRNRIKRRLRAVARATLPDHGKAGYDYNFIARHAAEDRNFEGLLDDAKRALLSLASKTT